MLDQFEECLHAAPRDGPARGRKCVIVVAVRLATADSRCQQRKQGCDSPSAAWP
jgi:hypothetical protein